MQLVVDVGNTDTKLAVFEPEGGRPLAVARIPTESAAVEAELRGTVRPMLQTARPTALQRVVIGSVSPRRTARIRETLEVVSPDAEVIVLSGFSGLPLRAGPEGYPEGVGADRIANALAATELEDGDVIVVDAGTATTVDCLGAGGVFVGGAIAPGVAAGAAWLRERAPHLPVLPLEAPAGSAIGRRTADALQSGTFYAAVEGAEGLVRRVRDAWGRPEVTVLVTGGYARLLAEHSLTFARVEPDLTLVGLALAGAVLST